MPILTIGLMAFALAFFALLVRFDGVRAFIQRKP
jgi:hypothetical protein